MGQKTQPKMYLMFLGFTTFRKSSKFFSAIATQIKAVAIRHRLELCYIDILLDVNFGHQITFMIKNIQNPFCFCFFFFISFTLNL